MRISELLIITTIVLLTCSCRKKQEYSSIFSAIQCGDMSAVEQWLRDNPGSIESRCEDSKRTPLIEAILDSQLDIAELLLKNGADVNAQDNWGYTSLRYAASSSSVISMRATKLLLEHGADPNIADLNEITPLHRAAGRDSLKKAGLLLKYGADVNATDEFGQSSLHYAAAESASEGMIRLLVRKGASLNLKAKTDMTPVDMLREKGWSEKRIHNILGDTEN